MTCDECGDRIFIGYEYWHNPDTDENYHLDCIPTDLTPRMEKRYREE